MTMDSIHINSYSKLIILHFSEAEHLSKAINTLSEKFMPEYETEMNMLKRLKVELDKEQN